MGRTLVYTDYTYHRVGGRVYSERAFSLFLARVAGALDGELTVIGRLSPEPGPTARYEIGAGVGFVALPHYRSLASARAVAAMLASLRIGWASIREADTVWLLGPHPLMIAFALFGLARGRRVVLGVRQDTLRYVAARHPGRRLLGLAARLLERSFRSLARRCPTIVVGPELARNYAHAPALLEIVVSLVTSDEIVDVEEALARGGGETRTMLSVGRLETEKNPLMLAAVLARLAAADRDWRLEVCGEGPLRAALEAELERFGLADRAELAGYVAHDDGLAARYRASDVLLQCSWTEGFPQTLLEAFAAGLPVVASDVGGIREAAGVAVRLFEPGDAVGAADAVAEVTADAGLRRAMIERGNRYIHEHTLERESARVAAFLHGGAP